MKGQIINDRAEEEDNQFNYDSYSESEDIKPDNS